MRILVTGANGFLGRALTRRLLATERFEQLTLFGRRIDPVGDERRVKIVEGDIRDPSARAAALEGGVDRVFHLAGVLIAQSEPDFELGRSVNLAASLALFDELRASGKPRIVFASTIGVYGADLPAEVDDETPARPSLSYGAHKLMGEIYLADVSRRGHVDGRSVRIPGTLPRPRIPDRAFSPAFGSNLFHALRARETFDCPVSAGATLWALSRERCIDGLLHAAALDEAKLPARRVWMLPALRIDMGELAQTLGRRLGLDVEKLVTWNPLPGLEQAVGALPPLKTPIADALGFRHDGDVASLVERTLAALDGG